MSVTLIPKRAACGRSIVKLRFGWPMTRKSLRSLMPAMRDMIEVTSWPFSSIIPKSFPKTLTASWPFVPLTTADRLTNVVFNRLREIPSRSGEFVNLTIHGSDRFFFVLRENRPSLFLRLQVDEELSVAESSGVGSVIGAADLRDDFGYLRKRCKNQARLVRKARAFRQARAGRQRAARSEERR